MTVKLNKKYNIIYCDPPWSYQGEMMNSSVTDHYKTMTLEDICNLPIKQLSDEDCILFLWVTFPKLNEFMKVVESWGFEFKSVGFVWIKTNKRTNPNQSSFFPEESFDEFMGQGRWTRANAEICVIATKGKIERKNAGVRQIIYSPIEEHSKKPAETRERIVSLVGDLPRIELFARSRTEGWDVFGNEVEGGIVL